MKKQVKDTVSLLPLKERMQPSSIKEHSLPIAPKRKDATELDKQLPEIILIPQKGQKSKTAKHRKCSQISVKLATHRLKKDAHTK